MSALNYPEWESWQQECRVCQRVRCPKPEKVGEWLEHLVERLHQALTPDLQGLHGWRWQVSSYESYLQCHALEWAWVLRGVCPECLKAEAPEVAEYLDTPERVHGDAGMRWDVLVPDYPAVGVVRVATPARLRPVAAFWRGGGLAVTPSVEFFSSGWTVTHERSGRAVAPRGLEREESVALAQLLAEVTDWEALDEAAIKSDLGLQERARAVLAVLSPGGAS